MKRFPTVIVLLFSLCIFSASVALEQHGHNEAAMHEKEKHGFGLKEYDAFHDILHPLQHEALPQKDFNTIRAKAPELTAAGKAIVKLGTPKGVRQNAVFTTELKVFNKALTKYTRDARSGDDAQLEASYRAVHDVFEELAGMLPRK